MAVPAGTIWRLLMINRPHLLSVIKQTSCLRPGHPLKQWANCETIIEQDEFELYQWPARSFHSLLSLAAEADGDPYLDALEVALKAALAGHQSPGSVGRSVQDVYISTIESAAKAADPLLEMLVANQAGAVAHNLPGTARPRFDVICWQLGCRLADPDPLYLSFYLSELWQYWNSFPRSYALSHLAVPPAKQLLRHLAQFDGGRFERLRRLLWLKADLELLIAELRTSDTRTSTQKCQDVRSQLTKLLELLELGEHEPSDLAHLVRPRALSSPSRDLAMTLFYLKQYQSGLELFRLSLLLGDVDGAEDIVETVGTAISDLGLTDAVI